MGVGKTGGIYGYSSLLHAAYIPHGEIVGIKLRNHTAGHAGSQNAKLRGFRLWLWVQNCRERARTESLYVGRRKKAKHILRCRV